MSSHKLPPEDFSRRIARVKKLVNDTLKSREERLSKNKGPQLPNFTKQMKEENTSEYSMGRTKIHEIDSEEYDQFEESYDDIPELRSRTITDAPTSTPESSTKRRRKTPGELMRMLNADNKVKKKKKKKSLSEGAMTSKQKEKETKLKEKYDDSDMKQNMIDQYGEERGTQIYFAKIRKMAMEEMQELDEYLEEKKLSRTARRATRVGKPGYDAEGKPKPKGKVRAWDMDETLMRNDPKKIRVHVKDKEGKRVQSLTNQEFNTHKLDKEKGHSYDFGEFRSSEKFAGASKPNKSMIKKLKKQVRRGKPVHIVTARGSFDDQPKFAKHLRRHGIEIDPGKGKGGRHVHVHRAGDMPGDDIGEKKVKIVKGLMKKHGTSGAEMYDDAAKVHRAFKKSAKETPTQPKVKTKMVQPNKKDVTQARSFKEEIDLDLIYDFILEQLIAEGYVESYDEATSLVEDFSDELLEDLIQESYEIIHSILTEEETIKIDYVSPYKKLQEKKEIKQKYMVEEIEMTPYEYWKSFIGDDEEISEELVNEEVLDMVVEERSVNSYQKWKNLLESK